MSHKRVTQIARATSRTCLRPDRRRGPSVIAARAVYHRIDHTRTHMTSPTDAPITSNNDVALVVRLPLDLRNALRERAAAEDRSVASLMRIAARTYLDSEAVQ